MNLLFVTEARFVKDKNGNFYGDASFTNNLWARYLVYFSHIYIMARVEKNDNFIGEKTNLSSSENVTFIELPYFVGPIQYLKVRTKLIKTIVKNLESLNVKCICRIPGTISNLVIKQLIKKNISYGVEVVGDPWDVFAPGTIKHPLRSYFRWQGYYDLKYNIKNAQAVLYVTKETLQNRYPCSTSAFQVSSSDVIIKDELIEENSKNHEVKDEYKLISIGSLEQMYKSPDIVLRAVMELNKNKINCKLIWLGDGIFKTDMENLSKELGISDKVEFKGNVSSNEVRKYLAEADIFVLASRTEGLPRAIIEAMSIGLPCVGTNVGGIPELLHKVVLVPKNDAQALFKKIKRMIVEPNFYNQQAKQNLNEAHNYKESILTKKRNLFYNFLKDSKK